MSESSNVEIPVEPGLYWASRRIKGRYDSLLHITGEAPFLCKRVIKLPVFIEKGTPMHVGFPGEVKAVGPKLSIPDLDGK
jgi:hypothetical protein